MAGNSGSGAGKPVISIGGTGGGPGATGDGGTSKPSGPAIGAIDPATGGTADGTGGSDGPRKRGRPRGTGSGSGRKAKEAAIDVSSLASIMAGIHTMIAAATNIDEIALDDKEAEQLSKSMVDVAKHYNVAVAEKSLAWVGLVTTCGKLYGPRLMAYKIRKAEEKDKKPQNVVNMPQPARPSKPTAVPVSDAAGKKEPAMPSDEPGVIDFDGG